MTTAEMEDLIWDLHSTYKHGCDLDEPNVAEDGWPTWGSYIYIHGEPERTERKRATRRQWVKDHLINEFDLDAMEADDLLQSVYWINEHFVYDERELSQYIEDLAERMTRRVHAGVLGSLQAFAENLLGALEDMKPLVKRLDPQLYERWKAGGFLVDPDIISMYPNALQVAKALCGEIDEDEWRRT